MGYSVEHMGKYGKIWGWDMEDIYRSTQFPIFSKSCVYNIWFPDQSVAAAAELQPRRHPRSPATTTPCSDVWIASSPPRHSASNWWPSFPRTSGWRPGSAGGCIAYGATVDQQHLMLTLRIRENLGHVLWYSPPNLRLPLSNHLVLTGPSQWCSHDFGERRLASAEYTVFRCETSWYHWYHWMIGVFDQSTITSIGIFPTKHLLKSTNTAGVNLHHNLPIIVRPCMAHRLPRNLKNLRHIQMSYAGRNALYRFYLS